MIDADDVNAALARAFREEGARVRGALLRLVNDLGTADDAVSAALEQALITWPVSGVPDVPAAWLTTVAKRKAIDLLRQRRRHDDIAVLEAEEEAGGFGLGGGADRHVADRVSDTGALERKDDRLPLVFASCHPLLPEDERVALTLQVVGGLTASEIARAFLVPVTTMEKRLARAKQQLRDAGVPYEVPPVEDLPERLKAVLASLYLVFNEGYLASRGDAVIRHELCGEALRIVRLVRSLLDEPEVGGLLALLLFTHARRDARVDDDGALVLLEDQDRARWDRRQIDEGLRIVDDVLSRRRPGPYQVQAAIAALHAQATSTSTTDWPQIAALYVALMRFVPTPVVRLNHAVAVAMAHGLDAGLSLVDVLGKEGDLDGYHLYWSTRGELLRRRGDLGAAKKALQRAKTLAPSPSEKQLLQKKLLQLQKAQPGL